MIVIGKPVKNIPVTMCGANKNSSHNTLLSYDKVIKGKLEQDTADKNKKIA